MANKVKIITNMGAANQSTPRAAAAGVAREMGFSGLKIAAIGGDVWWRRCELATCRWWKPGPSPTSRIG